MPADSIDRREGSAYLAERRPPPPRTARRLAVRDGAAGRARDVSILVGRPDRPSLARGTRRRGDPRPGPVRRVVVAHTPHADQRPRRLHRGPQPPPAAEHGRPPRPARVFLTAV